MAWIKALVVGMGVVLATGLVIIVVTLVTRTSVKEAAPVLSTEAQAALGPGERLVASSLDGGKVLLQIETPTGARVEIRSISDGGLIKRFKFFSPPK